MVTGRPVLEGIKTLLWIFFIAALVIGLGRFFFGLGAATNMTDQLPWGFWKVFNMVAGAALATSGFVVAAIIYIFQMEKYKSVARFSILVGFLGYGSSLVALLFDIGLPHRGWHPFFMWNPHSFLFEVFWCVSIYWFVTAFELLPLITERFPFPKFTHFIHEVMLPAVILGITLSTMHHSSLGSLFMVSPTRLHPLWYSLWIPPEFFISAMGAGLSVIVLLQIIMSWLYKQEINMKVLTGLVKGSAGFLLLYLVIKVADFTVNDKWNFVFGPDITWETYLFWVESLLQVIIPLAIFLYPKTRNSIEGLIFGTTSAFIGIVMHRLNTGIVGYFRSAESVYVPNFSELLLGLGLICGAGLVFLFLLERFYIFKEPVSHGDHHDSSDIELWSSAEAQTVFLGSRAKKVGIIAVIVIPITWFFFRDQATGPFQPIVQPVEASIIGVDPLREVLRIDGNLANEFVDFPHKKHQEAFIKEYGMIAEETCVECHHLNLPNDNASNCRLCHSDMQLKTAIFDPDAHIQHFRADPEFDIEAFMKTDLSDRRKGFEACFDCHEENMKGLAAYAVKGFDQEAPGFKDVMHGSCQTCHRQREEDRAKADDNSNCLFCHKINP